MREKTSGGGRRPLKGCWHKARERVGEEPSGLKSAEGDNWAHVHYRCGDCGKTWSELQKR